MFPFSHNSRRPGLPCPWTSRAARPRFDLQRSRGRIEVSRSRRRRLALHLRACLASFSISRSASQSAVRIPPEAAPPGRLSVCVSVLALVLTHRCAGPRQGSPPLPVGFWVVPPCATVLAPPWCSHSFRGAPPARCRSCECSGFALQWFPVGVSKLSHRFSVFSPSTRAPQARRRPSSSSAPEPSARFGCVE